MKIEFGVQEIIETVAGRLVSGSADAHRGSVCDDIERLEAGQWYIALPEKRRDGHDFLKEAHERGALGSIVLDRRRYPFAHPASVLVGTNSTLNAHYELARRVREKVNPKVIAITGSSGKSTTRDMLVSILSRDKKVHTSEGNKPDARNLARTLLSMPCDTDYLVIEVAQRGRGQIAWLGTILSPDIAIVTNIGPAHIDTLGSIENISFAKCELFETLNPETGLAILGDQNHNLTRRAQIVLGDTELQIYDENSIEEIAVTPEHTIFSNGSEGVLFELKAHGNAYIRDAWCAISCARHLGMADHEIAEGLKAYTPPRGRGNRSIGMKDALIIDESFSATPDSVRAAVSAFLDPRAVPYQRKVIVLGAMESLGEASEAIHRRLGNWFSGLSFESLVLLGQPAGHVARGLHDNRFEVKLCQNADEVVAVLEAKIDEATAVLVDGSESVPLRAVIRKLTSPPARV